MQQSWIWRVHSSTESLSELVPLLDAPNQSPMKEQLSSLVIILIHFIIYLNIYKLATINPLGARVFLKKCWILTSRFQKLVAWKGLKIEIYCKLEKCWAWPKVYVGCKITNLICILWRQQGGGPLEFHNIQEIVDIKLMFELFACLFVFLSFYPHSKWSEKRKSTIKQEKVLNITILLSYIVVKLMWTVAYFLISSSVIFRK